MCSHQMVQKMRPKLVLGVFFNSDTVCEQKINWIWNGFIIVSNWNLIN